MDLCPRVLTRSRPRQRARHGNICGKISRPRPAVPKKPAMVSARPAPVGRRLLEPHDIVRHPQKFLRVQCNCAAWRKDQIQYRHSGIFKARPPFNGRTKLMLEI